MKFNIGDHVQHNISGTECTVLATKFESAKMGRGRILPIDAKDYVLSPRTSGPVRFIYANDNEFH